MDGFETINHKDGIVTVTVELNDTKEITAFDFIAADNAALESDVSGNINGTAIDLSVPSGTNLTALVASFTTTGEVISVGAVPQTSGTTANDFTSPVTYTVTAEDGSTADYIVTVNIAVTPYLDFTYGTGGCEVKLSTEGNSAQGAGTIDSIEIPAEYNGEPVNAISFRGFDKLSYSGCSNLVSISIPDRVTSIGEYAFRNCSSLTEIIISGDISVIGDGTFTGCTSLSSVSLPDNITSIGVSAFQNCASLTSIVIPAQVESIDDYAFSGCSNLSPSAFPTALILSALVPLRIVRVSAQFPSRAEFQVFTTEHFGTVQVYHPSSFPTG